MAEQLTQQDMDALFSALTSPPAPAVSEPALVVGNPESPDLDMDALFSALTSPPVSSESAAPTLGGDEPAPQDGGKSLSQDEIDKLLAEFGLG